MKSCILPNGETCYYIDKFSALASYDEIINKREYEKYGIKVKDGDVIFDVGANIGIFSRFIATNANDLKIYIFEPVPDIFLIQKKNLEFIKSTQEVHPYNIGLGDIDKNVEINYYPRATTLSTIVPIDFELELKNSVENWDQTVANTTPIARFIPKFLRKTIVKLAYKYVFKEVKVPIKVRALSDIIKETNVDSIDFLKIDAENYEWQILQGITESDWKLIKQIAMEVHTNIKGGENLLEKITNLLKSKEFNVIFDKEGRFSATGVYMLYAKK
ncbi:MAG: FkbM family methyltransferase [Promethearchaeota archaeon]